MEYTKEYPGTDHGVSMEYHGIHNGISWNINGISMEYELTIN